MNSKSNLLDNADLFRYDDSGRSPAYFSKLSPTRINREMIHALVEKSDFFGKKNIRICLHQGSESDLHNMIVLLRTGTYCRPHKHKKKSEFYQVISGRGLIVLFDEHGRVNEKVILDPDHSFVFRIDPGVFHVLIPLEDPVVFHEARSGPYLGREESIYPHWAPDDPSLAEGVRWMTDIIGDLGFTQSR